MTMNTTQSDGNSPDLSYIATPLRHLVVPIDSVSPDPANCRQHSPRNLETIAASLRAFGQVKPIVADINGVIRAGNGSLAAAKMLGWSHIAVVKTTLSGSQAVAYGIADNRSGDSEIGSLWNPENLTSTLDALHSEGLSDVTGFTVDEIAALLAGSQPSTPPAGAGGQDIGENCADAVPTAQCPKCGEVFPV